MTGISNKFIKHIVILSFMFIASECFAEKIKTPTSETTKEEDIEYVFSSASVSKSSGTTACSNFNILDKTYLDSKRLIDSFYVCSLVKENTVFINELKEEKLNARNYSGFVDVKKLRELQYNIVTNNKLIKQFNNVYSCQTSSVKDLMSCLDTNYGDSTFKTTSKCEKYVNIAILIDYFYYEMGLCEDQVGASNKYENCEKDWSFPSIKRPPCR